MIEIDAGQTSSHRPELIVRHIPTEFTVFDSALETRNPRRNTERISALYPQFEEAPSSLTPRQKRILEMISEGKNYADIATELGISVKTVETQLFWNGSILEATGSKSTLEAIYKSITSKAIPLPEIPKEKTDLIETLSEKEMEVFEFLVSPVNLGLTRKETRRRLHMSKSYQELFITHIYSKLGISGKPQSLVFALNVKRNFESLRNVTNDNPPSDIELITKKFDSLELPLKKKKALLSYYLWLSDNGEYEKIRKFLKIQDDDEISALLDMVMDDNDLSEAYSRMEIILDSSMFIFKRWGGKKDRTEQRFNLIYDKVSALVGQGFTADQIKEFGEEINHQTIPSRNDSLQRSLDIEASDDEEPKGKLSTRRTTVRMKPLDAISGRRAEGIRNREALKKILDLHLEIQGKSPIDLREVAGRPNMPSYMTLLSHYRSLAKTQEVPPLKLYKRESRVAIDKTRIFDNPLFASLPNNAQRELILHFQNGKSLREIGQSFGLSGEAVRLMELRSLKQLGII